MKKINLEELSIYPPDDFDKGKTKKKVKKLRDELDELQNMLYAENKWSLLIVMQGMDAAGKDGAIRKVFRKVNPNGIRVQSFKKPTEEELSHDFLWRIHKHTPATGMIQVFNRSHYEDVLVTRVLGLCDDKTAKFRFEAINAFEKNLAKHGTKILKFYLHIDEVLQQKKFQERLDNPRKNWKYNPNDLKTAKHWPEYRQYYQEVFEKCSEVSPWIIVPSAKNWYKEYIVAKTVVETLKSLDMKYPKYSGTNEE